MAKGWVLALIAVVGAALSVARPIPARADCKLVELGEFRVVVRGRRILIPSELDGQKVYFILDTGGGSLLFPDAARRLDVHTHNVSGLRMYGVGGEVEPRVADFQSLKLGSMSLPSGQMIVGSNWRDRSGDIAGTIGYDVFARHDLEFDLAHNVVRVLTTTGCSDDQMDYWRAPYAVTPLRTRGGEDTHSYVEVRLNGSPVEAILDTGSPVSTVTLAGAERAGVRPNSPGVRQLGTMRGLGAGETPVWIAPFNSFSMGEEKIANPHLAVADMFHNDTALYTGSNVPVAIDMPGMLVGLDFFMAHHVLISREHQKVYFSYNGGPIFEPPTLGVQATSRTPAGPSPAGDQAAEPTH